MPSLPVSPTRPARTTAVVPVDICRRVRMALWTVRLSRVDGALGLRTRSQQVFPLRYGPQVRGIHTQSDATKMVNDKAIRNGADANLIRKTVGKNVLSLRAASAKHDHPVAAIIGPSQPEPATVGLIGQPRKACFQGNGSGAPVIEVTVTLPARVMRAAPSPRMGDLVASVDAACSLGHVEPLTRFGQSRDRPKRSPGLSMRRFYFKPTTVLSANAA